MNTELQLQDSALRLRVRERIKGGRLPVMVPTRIDAGYWSGHVYQPMTSTQVEYELAGIWCIKRATFRCRGSLLSPSKQVRYPTVSLATRRPTYPAQI